MTIGIIGDYDPQYALHASTDTALARAGASARWIPTQDIDDDPAVLDGYGGLLINVGSPYKSMDGALAAIRYAAMARGKAELGAKTIIDGLDALASGIEGKTDAASVAAAAEKAMDEVLAKFRHRPSAMGRARMFAEKSIGLDDPGMLALAELVHSLAKPAQHDSAPVA